MADTQPVPTPAPDGGTATPPQEPAATPAEPQQPQAQTVTLDSFSDEEKKYLESQGVKDFSSADAIKKIINHAQSSQKTAAQIKAELDKVKNVVAPPAPDTNPFGQPAATPPTPDAQPEEVKGIDPVTAYTLSNNLATNFPELKEDLLNGNFYKEMQELGTPLLVNGQVNLNGILKYGSQAQKIKQLEAQIEEANKPGNIPDAKVPDTPSVADDAPMTKQIAQAILLQDPNGHPRAQEAKNFVASNPL